MDRKFVIEMKEAGERKERELERRTGQVKELIKKSDQAFKTNVEQWEAYQRCIEHQHTKMTSLIHDLLVLRVVLGTIEEETR